MSVASEEPSVKLRAVTEPKAIPLTVGLYPVIEPRPEKTRFFTPLYDKATSPI